MKLKFLQFILGLQPKLKVTFVIVLRGCSSGVMLVGEIKPGARGDCGWHRCLSTLCLVLGCCSVTSWRIPSDIAICKLRSWCLPRLWLSVFSPSMPAGNKVRGYRGNHSSKKSPSKNKKRHDNVLPSDVKRKMILSKPKHWSNFITRRNLRNDFRINDKLAEDGQKIEFKFNSNLMNGIINRNKRSFALKCCGWIIQLVDYYKLKGFAFVFPRETFPSNSIVI